MTLTSETLDTCVFGHGIVCGLEVHIDENCNVHVSPGSAIMTAGKVMHLHVAKQFQRYYKKNADEQIKKYFSDLKFWELAEKGVPLEETDWLKAQYPIDQDPQAPAEGHGTFLQDKILVVYVDPANVQSPFRFLLLRDDDVAKFTGIAKQAATLMAADKTLLGTGGIFAKNKKQQLDLDPEKIDQVLRPALQLTTLRVARFGYGDLTKLKSKALSRIDNIHPIDYDAPPLAGDKKDDRSLLDNLRNPFSAVASFNDIFQEYKAILDKSVPQLHDALAKLHQLFGPVLSHRDDAYLERYRSALTKKWFVFKCEGEHLYYIQDFYDWVCDLVKAYEELRAALDDFAGTCHCEKTEGDPDRHLLLGPISGGRTSYQPLIFRDHYQQPMIANDNEDRLHEIKCLHWRLLMMIWTFDLPFLHLEQKKYVKNNKPEAGAELKDSTDYWEGEDHNQDAVRDIEDVPVKITPSHAFHEPLGRWTIPYYYPLDMDSPYSVHRYWDYHTTKMNRVDTLLSFNANRGEDSYSKRVSVLFPLAYNLREYSFFRVEGLVGKKLKTDEKSVVFKPVMDHLLEIINKYNLCIDVLAVDVYWEGLKVAHKVSGRIVNANTDQLLKTATVEKHNFLTRQIITIGSPDLKEGEFNNVVIEKDDYLRFSNQNYISQDITIGLEESIQVILSPELSPAIVTPPIKIPPHYPTPLSKLLGLERSGGIQPGQTLVILYTSRPVQIELAECRKDTLPEVAAFTIVGDFTLPYRYSCCHQEDAPLQGVQIVARRNAMPPATLVTSSEPPALMPVFTETHPATPIEVTIDPSPAATTAPVPLSITPEAPGRKRNNPRNPRP